MRCLSLTLRLAEEAAEEVEILEHAQRRVEVAPEALRHVGDAGQAQAAMFAIPHVAAKREDFALLDPANAGNEREQGGFADAVGSDEPDHATGRDRQSHVVERDRPPIAMRQACHPCGIRCHGSFTARLSGQGASGSVRTNPTPRSPVFT